MYNKSDKPDVYKTFGGVMRCNVLMEIYEDKKSLTNEIGIYTSSEYRNTTQIQERRRKKLRER